MKKQIFSRSLFGQALQRLKTFTIILTVVSIVTTISPFIEYLYWIITGYVYSLGNNYSIVNSFQLVTPLILIATVCAFVMPYVVFCQFNSRRYSDFYLSLPYTRTCIFVSFTAAVFTMLLGMCATVIGLELILYTSFSNYFIINFAGFGVRLVTILSAMLFVAAVSTLASSFTHKTFAAIVTGLVIGVAPRLLIAAIQITTNLTTSILTMVPLSSVFSSSLNSLVYVFSSMLSGNELSLLPALYTTVISVGYFILANYFFKIKKSEDNAQPAHNKLLQAVIRILLGVALTIIPSMLIVGTVKMDIQNIGFIVVLTIPAFLIAAVAYFAYELITTKKWKRVLAALPGFAIVLGIDLLCAICVITCSNIALGYVPKAESIDSVKIVDDSDNYMEEMISGFLGIDDLGYSNNSFEEAANAIEFDSPEIKEIVSKALRENTAQLKGEDVVRSYTERTMTFAIKDHGITRYRNISLTTSEYEGYLKAVSENEKYRKVYTTVPPAIIGTLYSGDCGKWKPDANKTNEVLATLQSEIDELGFDKWNASLNRNAYSYFDKQTETESVNVTFIAKGSTKKTYVPIYADVTPKTFGLIIADFYDCTKDDAKKQADRILKMDYSETTDKGVDYKYCSIDISLNNDEDDIRLYSYFHYDNSYYYDIEVDMSASGKENLETCKAVAAEINKIIEAVKNEKPTTGKYISVRINCEDYSSTSDYGLGIYEVPGQTYLPIPEGYDASTLIELIENNNKTQNEEFEDEKLIQIKDI